MTPSCNLFMARLLLWNAIGVTAYIDITIYRSVCQCRRYWVICDVIFVAKKSSNSQTTGLVTSWNYSVSHEKRANIFVPNFVRIS